MKVHYLIISFCLRYVASDDSMPLPFSRELIYVEGSSLESGSDVLIMQTLINRSPLISQELDEDGYYGADSADAVSSFQTGNALPVSGVFDNATATSLLACCQSDGYMDDGQAASAYGKLYKIIVPLPSTNRSVEAVASLFDENNTFVRSFTVRAHGYRSDGTSAPWPDYGDGDIGLNEFSSNGNTPTGLSTIDLNSPEPSNVEEEYGPYPINRVVQGLEGNAKLLLGTTSSTIRSGVLLHTGEWPGWDDSMTMPNSEGCLHAHPEDIEAIWLDLVALGVTVNENPYSSINYPYDPQGLISVYVV
mmetsp:Transcript_52592/g.67427  ORF Transcript_52592/g.67427 Transcript_52592/m.67427 type:complete len:305 (-) Transcript_52592:94-1008(-)|eukprot:CAMPEP_0114361188 /NCGR_PEP_ID=MMETSP0101-20121206/24507_1 /TAXON_ID=38822 ORGANISM="Pteridomonas danica, Strain PT" /NCGR_SAMPLE_ID=MMETSP0101 /ASSEMBLY_ACC=CAM_ASM_000211 /LENGTH=304 /DNA_ID=CAMNT_0001505961 /DNA_START=25 /DNA_END=939 /DNA_ORIENTATION=+